MKLMLFLLIVALGSGLALYVLKKKGLILAAQAQTAQKETPFWQKLAGAVIGSEHFEKYRPDKPFEPEEVIRDLLDL